MTRGFVDIKVLIIISLVVFAIALVFGPIFWMPLVVCFVFIFCVSCIFSYWSFDLRRLTAKGRDEIRAEEEQSRIRTMQYQRELDAEEVDEILIKELLKDPTMKLEQVEVLLNKWRIDREAALTGDVV